MLAHGVQPRATPQARSARRKQFTHRHKSTHTRPAWPYCLSSGLGQNPGPQRVGRHNPTANLQRLFSAAPFQEKHLWACGVGLARLTSGT